jgi:uroporphyrinogen-III synthase
MDSKDINDTTRGLQGLRVVAFESRRAVEMAELIRRYGGEPLVAPSMREVPLGEHGAVFEYVRRLAAGEIDVVILLTGVGLRTLADLVASEWPRDRLATALRRAHVVARGPKPGTALREMGLEPDVTVPAPNTWREILATLDMQLPVAGKRVAILEYGVSNQELATGLVTRGAEVLRVAIYRWALPDDLSPLRGAIRAVRDAHVDIALFTSATQVYHLFQVAGDAADDLRGGFEKIVIASIGPICSEALRAHGLTPDLEPEQAKMGQLVRAVALQGRVLLEGKRASPRPVGRFG